MNKLKNNRKFLKMKKPKIIKLYHYLIFIFIIFRFQDHSVNTINTSPDKIEKFLQAILYVYSTDVKSEKSRLAHSLSEMGFLQFVTRVISFADFG